MEMLSAEAGEAGASLKNRRETVSVAESSTGGLISAALLALPGASAYFRGGTVVYTREAKQALAGVTDADIAAARAATETHAVRLARAIRERLGTDWAVGETGAAGPTGNRYGDPAGHSCIAVVGPVERVITIATGEADRVANMRAFDAAALGLLRDAIKDAEG